MVKLIVLDVDGVIVGNRAGINFPYPNQKVLSALKKVRQKGFPVVLCSGKYHPAIEPIILRANLNNPHITDSGALIIDPIAKKIIRSFDIEKNLVSDIINTCLQNNIYVEAYSADDYFIQKDQMSEMTARRTLILQRDPMVVDSLIKKAQEHKIIKLLPVATGEHDRKRIENLLRHYNGQVTFIWSMHPSSKPLQYCLTTSINASKAHAVKEVIKNLSVSFEETLGVGDTLGDWEFMKFCSFVAAMEDGAPELKELVESKGEGKYFIAPSVDNDGIISIFNYFLKLKL